MPLAAARVTVSPFGRLVPATILCSWPRVGSSRRCVRGRRIPDGYLKTRAPFWKREERGGDTTWVDARGDDDAAVERWKRRADAAE